MHPAGGVGRGCGMSKGPVKARSAATTKSAKRKRSFWVWVSVAVGGLILIFTCLPLLGDWDSPVRWLIGLFGAFVGLMFVFFPFLDFERRPNPLADETPHGDAGLAPLDKSTRALRGETDWQGEA